MKYYFMITVLLRIVIGLLCEETWPIPMYDISSIPSELDMCDDRSYRCDDGSCIPGKYRCNGMTDCNGGEDEQNCGNCPVNFCPCTDGSCIDINDRCNEKTDCVNEAEDEENCAEEITIHKIMWNFYTPKRQCTFNTNYIHGMKVDCSNMELSSLPCITNHVDVLILNNNKLGLFNGLSNLSFMGRYYNSLRILEIDKNHIENLPSKMLENNRYLFELSLAGNEISHLYGFIFPSSLDKLHLQNNKIKNLPPKLFKNLNKLKDLSLAHNQIEFLHEKIFSDLRELIVLNLTQNSIKTLKPNTFPDLVKLNTMDLSHNQIAVITNGSFQGLNTLRKLYLNFNKITKLTADMFQSQEGLSELFLQNNRISIIATNAFNQLKMLKTLDLSYNKLTQLGLKTFENLRRMNTLFLNDNHIVEIHDNTLSSMMYLKNLFINRNKIRKLFFFPRCTSTRCVLTCFNIGENEIEVFSIASTSFTNYYFNDLSLQHNKLRTLTSRMLNGTTIRSLKLNNNQIDTIEDYAFAGLVTRGGGSILLNSNNITRITSRMFEGIFGKWEKISLKLNDNQITKVEDYAFRPFNYLRLLDLSSNALSKVTANMFQGVEILNDILLQNNKIEGIERYSFREMKHLNMIDLSNNWLTKLPPEMFQGSQEVQRLYFQNNKIEHIELDTFYNMTELTDLNLSNNRLSKLHSYVLKSLFKLRNLYLQNNRIGTIENDVFRNLTKLLILDLSDNVIAELKSNMFKGLFTLQTLYVRKNRVKKIEDFAFKSLNTLTTLDLSDNEIISLPPNMLSDCKDLRILHLQNNRIKIINEIAFSRLVLLSTLNLKNNQIGDIQPTIFKDLEGLQRLIADEFRFCCLKKNIKKCESPRDEFSSCEDLMKNSLLRTSVWILGIISIFANSFVIIFRIKYQSANTNLVNSLLIKNLAVSDSFMGIYLVIIATMDTTYRGEYYIHDKYWRESYWCNFAGFLSTFSSELTVFILTILSMDRLYTISFPIRAKQRGISRAKKLLAMVWILAAIISLLPLPFFKLPFFKNFYGRSGVCLPLHITTDTPPGWQYSVFIFIILNAILFAVIAVCYSSMFVITTRARRSITSSNRSKDTAIAFRMTLLVMADASCWIPIITLGIRSLMGINPSPQVYPWIAVFVLPLNAALNPILYTISSIPMVIKVTFPNSRLNGRLMFTWPCHWVATNKVRRS